MVSLSCPFCLSKTTYTRSEGPRGQRLGLTHRAEIRYRTYGIVARREGHDLIKGCCIIYAAKTGFVEDQDTRAATGVAVSSVRISDISTDVNAQSL